MEKTYFSNSCRVDYCAITGAAAFFCGIRNSVVVINGSKFCFLQMLHYLERAFRYSLKERIFCTELQESSVIYGNEAGIKDVLSYIKDNLSPAVIFIQNNCAASLIGDDAEGIAREFGFSCPVFTLDSGGIRGGFQEGYRLAAKSFFRKFSAVPAIEKKKRCINIVGASEAYYNYLSDKEELIRLLSMAGIKVLNFISDVVDLAQLALLRQAEYNIVLHEELGLEVAELLKQKFSMPYLLLKPPYGVLGTKQWLLEICGVLEVPEREVNAINGYFAACLEDEQRCTHKLVKDHGEIWLDEVNIAGPKSLVLGLAEALRKEFLNYGRMNLFIYDTVKPQEINDQYYFYYEQFLPEKIMGTKSWFLFGSFSEHVRLYQKFQNNEPGYCCIAHPSSDFASFTPLMGVAGAKRLLEILWQYYIDSSLMRILGEKQL